MLEIVSHFIDQHALLPAHSLVVVAVSGGADSLCLLHLLTRLCGPTKLYPSVRLHVAHLNHLLRPTASTHDAEVVESYAKKLGLEVTIGVADVPALAQNEHRSLEEAARIARYRFLRTVAAEQCRAGETALIATAHHQDDQVETLLLHFVRGGGIASMVGLQPRQQDIIRPLLAISHADTLAYCREHALPVVEDESNNDLRFIRNRVRHQLLPLFEAINPGFRSTLLRNAEVLRIDAQWIDEQVAAHWSHVVIEEDAAHIALHAPALLAVPLSLQRHLLRRASAQLCAGQSPLELRHYQLIEELLQREATEAVSLHLPQQLRLTYQYTTFVLSISHSLKNEQRRSPRLDGEVELPLSGEVELPGTRWRARAELLSAQEMLVVKDAILQRGTVPDELAADPTVVYLDGDQLDLPLLIRTRRVGDRMQPLGMAHEKKVQDILVDKRVPRAQREQIPLFFSGPHCIWLAGVTIAHTVRITPATRRIARLSIISTICQPEGDHHAR